MKTTYNWLREYCDFSASPREAADLLTMSGLEVEELTDLGDDWLISAEVTSNRPDLLGTIGIARELSALTGRPLRMPPADFHATGKPAPEAASVRVDAPELCPRYTARILRNVKLASSPPWLARRLEAIGLRPVNNVVDITNFVLFECCQPLHAFDFDALEGGQIIVRRAAEGEQIVAIDGSRHTLKAEHLVIADARRPVAIAGIMGGLQTEIGSRTSTVLLESAQFHPANNRATSRALGLASDSSYRFERGVDPVNTEWASRRCAHLMQKLCGAEVAPGLVDCWAEPFRPKTVTLRMERMDRLLGLEVPAPRAAQILASLGLEVVRQDGRLIEVAVPPFRGDLEREVDLIEEVARIHGLDKIPVRTALFIAAGRRSAAERATRCVSDMLVGCGHYEVLTSSFQDEATSRLVSPWTSAEPLTFNNVVRREENRLRVSVMPGLLAAKRTNEARGVGRVKLFEITKVYLPRPGEKLPEERFVLAMLGEEGLPEMKGAVEAVLDALRVRGKVEFEALSDEFFEAGAAAQAVLDGHRAAVLGQVSRTVAGRFDLRKAPFLAEMDFARLVAAAQFDVKCQRLPPFPASERDLAVVVDEGVTWARIEACVRGLNMPTLESMAFFDIYRGKPVPPGKKSLAFRMVFRAPDRTLTGEEVESEWKRTVEALTRELGGELRS